jgi:hypothetical protein
MLLLCLLCVVIIIGLIDYLLDLNVLLIEEVIVIGHYPLAVLFHYDLPGNGPEAHLSRRRVHPWLRLLIDTNSLIIELDGMMSHLKGIR